jgi:hypothetical protein
MNARRSILSLFSLVLLTVCFEPNARASYTMTITQNGTNVVGQGSGSLNITGLPFDGVVKGGATIWGSFLQGGSAAGLGPLPGVQVDAYGATLRGSATTFGAGSEFDANSGSGDAVDIAPGYAGDPFATGEIYVPVGYVSGTALSDTAIWDNTTVSALGLIPGTYTYTWGGGTANADSFTLIIGATPAATAPEPGSWCLCAAGAAALVFRRLRKRT